MSTQRIEANLRRLAFDKEVNISQISRETGISRTTLTALYKNTSTGITFEVLEKLCSYFDCTVGDILKVSTARPA